MIAGGTKPKVLKTVMGGRCGHWERSWAGPKIRDCGVLPGVCSNFPFPAVLEFSSPRAWAYTLLGIQEYLNSYPGDRDAQKIRNVLSRRLLEMYESIRSPDWKWFENVVAYGNARLPQALLIVGSACSDDRMVSAGLEALDWLTETQHCETNHHFVPIGSQGFYHQGGEKARFDQQPIEAAGAVSACLEAYRVTGDSRWRTRSLVGFQLVSGRQRSASPSL